MYGLYFERMKNGEGNLTLESGLPVAWALLTPEELRIQVGQPKEIMEVLAKEFERINFEKLQLPFFSFNGSYTFDLLRQYIFKYKPDFPGRNKIFLTGKPYDPIYRGVLDGSMVTDIYNWAGCSAPIREKEVSTILHSPLSAEEKYKVLATMVRTVIEESPAPYYYALNRKAFPSRVRIGTPQTIYEDKVRMPERLCPLQIQPSEEAFAGLTPTGR